MVSTGNCYVLLCALLEIARIVFSPTISKNQVPYLQRLIQEHHERFKELFPHCNIIPKCIDGPYAKDNIAVKVLEIRMLFCARHVSIEQHLSYSSISSWQHFLVPL